MINSDFKRRLHNYCIVLLEQRMDANRKAMVDAQESANTEEKSSAGDKYETGRAMSQIQRDMSAKQLKVVNDELKELKKLNPEQQLTKAVKGALIQTDASVIYIAAGLGTIEFESIKMAIVSVTSPLAVQLSGKSVGDEFAIAGKQHRVINVL
ncbi:MAG: 3-oxoacyl-ACP synthase [Bacteroidota bacterium]